MHVNLKLIAVLSGLFFWCFGAIRIGGIDFSGILIQGSCLKILISFLILYVWRKSLGIAPGIIRGEKFCKHLIVLGNFPLPLRYSEVLQCYLQKFKEHFRDDVQEQGVCITFAWCVNSEEGSGWAHRSAVSETPLGCACGHDQHLANVNRELVYFCDKTRSDLYGWNLC